MPETRCTNCATSLGWQMLRGSFATMTGTFGDGGRISAPETHSPKTATKGYYRRSAYQRVSRPVTTAPLTFLWTREQVSYGPMCGSAAGLGPSADGASLRRCAPIPSSDLDRCGNARQLLPRPGIGGIPRRPRRD